MAAGDRLLIVQFVRRQSIFRNNLFLFPAITLFSFVEVVMVSAAMLLLAVEQQPVRRHCLFMPR